MKKVKSIFSKAKCKLGYHSFERNNAGIEEHIMYDFYRCKYCDRYTIICHGYIHNRTAVTITSESILRAKERYDKVHQRKVLMEKTIIPKSRRYIIPVGDPMTVNQLQRRLYEALDPNVTYTLPYEPENPYILGHDFFIPTRQLPPEND